LTIVNQRRPQSYSPVPCLIREQLSNGELFGVLILLGMVAYLTGGVQALLTAFVIVTEMTADHPMVVRLMAAAFVAWAVSRLVWTEGV
jgi:H+/Cl- antiporter ClcA